MKYDLVIYNAVLCMEQGLKNASLAIKDGVIYDHLPAGSAFDAVRSYDANGNIVLPGICDTHVHLGQGHNTDEAFREDAIHESRAALQGGVTTLFTTTLGGNDSLNQYLDRALNVLDSEALYTNIKLTTAPGNEEQIREIAGMAKRGVAGYKFYLGYRGEAARNLGMPEAGFDCGVMYRGFEAIAKAGAPCFAMCHCEDPAIKDHLVPIISSEVPKDGNYLSAFNEAQPAICEAIDICKSAYIAHEVGCPLYIVHVSAKESVDQIEYFQKKGFDIMGETCPHYLAFNCDDPEFITNDYKSRTLKLNPPVRAKADRERLWQGIRDGVISTIGTDSCPILGSKKFDMPWWEGATGCGIGLGCSLMVMLTEGVSKGRITIDTLRKIMCENPAKRFGVYPYKGTLSVGADADVVVIDIEKTGVIHLADSESRCNYSPYEGFGYKGAPVATFVNGSLAAENYKIVDERAHGKLLGSPVHARAI